MKEVHNLLSLRLKGLKARFNCSDALLRTHRWRDSKPLLVRLSRTFNDLFGRGRREFGNRAQQRCLSFRRWNRTVDCHHLTISSSQLAVHEVALHLAVRRLRVSGVDRPPLQKFLNTSIPGRGEVYTSTTLFRSTHVVSTFTSHRCVHTEPSTYAHTFTMTLPRLTSISVYGYTGGLRFVGNRERTRGVEPIIASHGPRSFIPPEGSSPDEPAWRPKCHNAPVVAIQFITLVHHRPL
jgi:hypothetical protein